MFYLLHNTNPKEVWILVMKFFHRNSIKVCSLNKRTTSNLAKISKIENVSKLRIKFDADFITQYHVISFAIEGRLIICDRDKGQITLHRLPASLGSQCNLSSLRIRLQIFNIRNGCILVNI